MKRIVSAMLVLLLLAAFCGCSNVKTSMSWTYKVETGDAVRVTLNTTDGYSISSNVPFTISHDGNDISHGTFIKGEACEQYRNAATTQEGAKWLEEGTIGVHKYFAWSFNDTEWNYCIELDGGKTGILLGNIVSQDSAKEVFSRLTIEIAS